MHRKIQLMYVKITNVCIEDILPQQKILPQENFTTLHTIS